MGCEGKASYEYWSGIKLLVPPAIGFEQRNQKPTDILNSILNYGYAILAGEITKSILLNGLDPYCGFLHFDRDNRTSLTYDLIEDFRQQIVDKTVINTVFENRYDEAVTKTQIEEAYLEYKKEWDPIIEKVNSKAKRESINMRSYMCRSYRISL